MMGQVVQGIHPLSPILAECIERLQRQHRQVQCDHYRSVYETQMMVARVSSFDEVLERLERHRRQQLDHDRGQHRSRSPGGREAERAASEAQRVQADQASSAQVQTPSTQDRPQSVQVQVDETSFAPDGGQAQTEPEAEPES